MDILIGATVILVIAGAVYYAKRKKAGKAGFFDRNDPPTQQR